MSTQLPSDASMQAYIEKRVRAAEDISLLSRTILKDGLVKKFKMTDEQKILLDTDKHYKSLIKVWIQDAIVSRT
jgi:hypothetical protein